MSYSHFTPFERGSIFQLLELGYSHNNIAKCLNRHRSSIDREINRNSIDGVYIPDLAQNEYKKRSTLKGRKSKENKYKDIIKTHIRLKWSPEQISNTVLKDQVSSSSIYRWIYSNKIDDITYEDLRHKGKLVKLKGDKRSRRFAHEEFDNSGVTPEVGKYYMLYSDGNKEYAYLCDKHAQDGNNTNGHIYSPH